MSPINQPMFFDLHGARASFETSHTPLAAFARRYLMNMIVSQIAHPQVIARLHWNERLPDSWKQAPVHQWGRRLFQSGNSVLQAEILPLPGLQVVASQADTVLCLDGYFNPSSRAEKLAAWTGKGREMLFSALLYYMVYFPLIFVLQQMRGWHLLHAGAVSRPAGGWLLAGLPGSGKSTLTLALLNLEKTYFLADNLLLHDDERVYAIPESIHLSAQSTALLPAAIRERLAKKGFNLTHQRTSLSLSTEGCSRQAALEALFILGLGDRLETRSIEQNTALERLLAFNQAAKEVIAYNQFAAPLTLIAPGAASARNQTESLASLLSETSCYEIWLERGASLEDAGNEMEALVDSSTPTEAGYHAPHNFLAESNAPA